MNYLHTLSRQSSLWLCVEPQRRWWWRSRWSDAGISIRCWNLHSAGAAKWINKGGGVVILVIDERNIMFMLIWMDCLYQDAGKWRILLLGEGQEVWSRWEKSKSAACLTGAAQEIWMQLIWPQLSSFTSLMLLLKLTFSNRVIASPFRDRKIPLIGIQLCCRYRNVSNFFFFFSQPRHQVFLSVFWRNVRRRDQNKVSCSRKFTFKTEIWILYGNRNYGVNWINVGCFFEKTLW